MTITSIGSQMNREELAKTFMMILNWNNPLVSMVYTKIIQCRNGFTFVYCGEWVSQRSNERWLL